MISRIPWHFSFLKVQKTLKDLQPLPKMYGVHKMQRKHKKYIFNILQNVTFNLLSNKRQQMIKFNDVHIVA